MPEPGPAPIRRSFLAASLPAAALVAAVGWFLVHLRYGLDFTDEMQYYGDIRGMVRTGHLFNDDLGIQQLVYVFVWPFFKLHAWLFPDEAYLILFGRVLLLAAYAATGSCFWRAVTRAGGYSPAHRLAALAVFWAWMPFQIFALSYNSVAYLMIVALLAAWLVPASARSRRHSLVVAVLLTILTYAYPPVGLAFIAVAAFETARQQGTAAAIRLVTLTALAGGLVLAVIAGTSGRRFVHDLTDVIAISRAYGVGATILMPDNLAGWFASIALGGGVIWRVRRGRPIELPWGLGQPTMAGWLFLALLVIAASALMGITSRWKAGYFSVTIYFALLLLLAGAIARPPETSAAGGPAAAMFRRLQQLVLGAGLVAVFAVLWIYLRPGTGYFAETVYLALLVVVTLTCRPETAALSTAAIVAGTVAGAIFAYTSSNGLHNFGIGAAAVLPFLVLAAARGLDDSAPRLAPGLATSTAVAVVFLLLVNNALHPYAEQPIWRPFATVRGVPAFRGLRTAPLKTEALARFRALAPPGSLQGRRVLVMGPAPWLYLLLGGEPATAMVFMHFDGTDAAYALGARRSLQEGQPDVVILTTTTLPRPFAEQFFAWSKPGFTSTSVTLPEEFIRAYERMTRYRFSPEVFLFRRTEPGTVPPK
ncbi:MAG TPA: hypothetical protein VG936_04920 [Lacunisphaera sp.]|nr:hypothetical protein [Lacunisphaera sp.]